MSDDRRGKGATQARAKGAANDNQGPALTPGEQPDAPPARRSPLRILTDFPERFPVMTGEVVLIETYLSDLIGAMIANDNE